MISSMISSQVNPSRAKLSRCRAYPWSAPLSLYICAYVFVIVWTSWYEVPPKCAGRGSQIASAEAAHLDLTSCSMSQQAKGLSPMGHSADILAIKDLMFKRRCGSVGTVRAASPASLPSTTWGRSVATPATPAVRSLQPTWYPREKITERCISQVSCYRLTIDTYLLLT